MQHKHSKELKPALKVIEQIKYIYHKQKSNENYFFPPNKNAHAVKINHAILK